jgi:hypothetical protein
MVDFSRFETEFDATRSFMQYASVRVPTPTAKRYSKQIADGSGLIGPSLLFKYGSGQPALSVSANSPIWHSACNRLAHGMGHGIRRAQQFDERSNSLAPRDFFRRVSPGLWWSRWPGFATAPSIRRIRKRHTVSGWPTWFVCTLPPSAAPFSARIRPGP